MARKFTLPDQTGQAGNALFTNGQYPYWAPSGGGGGGITIGESINGGTPTEILYTDNAGNLFSDARFTRDSSTNATHAYMLQNAGVDEAGFVIDSTLLGVPGTNGLLLRLADAAGTVGSAITGVLNLSPLGAPSNYGAFTVVDDAVTLESSRMFMLPSTIGFSSSDNVDAGLIQLSPGTADLGVDNVDGGGDDFAGIEARLNSGGGAQTLFGKYGTATVFYGWRVDSTGFTLDYDNFSGTPGTFYIFPTADGASGEVLTTDGAGNLSFTAIPPASAPLTENQIGFGDPSNLLDGSANFTYNSPLYYFNQLIPNNVNNGTAIGSPLTFGGATFTGSGLNDFTLTWSVSNYQSKKYGGNLTVSIISTGTPDEFNWIFTGPYSEIIGQGTNVSIAAGPVNLLDNDSNVIAQIEFAATTGHTFGDSWSAGTSLGAFGWGRRVADTDGHEFLKVAPESGIYFLGDDRIPSPLTGNGTALYINDAIAELGLFSNRYLRIENPSGTYTAVLADMQTQIWSNYGIFRVLDPASGSVWFDADAINHTVGIGDVQSTGNDTLFTVDDTNKTITGTSLISGTKNTSMKVGSIPGLSLPGSAFDYSDSVAGQSSSIGVGDFSGLGGNPNSGYMTWYTGATLAQSLLTTNSAGIIGLFTDGTGATYTNQFNLGASGFTLSSNSGSYTFPLSDGTAGQAPITDGAGQLAWGSVAQIFTATETFSSANILNLNGTPRVMVSAAGAGKLIVPIAAYVRLTYNSAPYATNTSLVLKYAGTTNQIMNNDYVLLSTATNLSSFAAPNSSLEDNTAVNADLELTVLGGNPTAGNSVMDVEVQYIIVNVSI